MGPSVLGPRAPSPVLSAKREPVASQTSSLFKIHLPTQCGRGARAPSINVRQLTGLYLKRDHLRAHRLSQGIDANQVSARLGVAADIFETYVSRYFHRN